MATRRSRSGGINRRQFAALAPAALACATHCRRFLASRLAETCHNHFRSTANQVESYLPRGELAKGPSEPREIVARMVEVARQ